MGQKWDPCASSKPWRARAGVALSRSAILVRHRGSLPAKSKSHSWSPPHGYVYKDGGGTKWLKTGGLLRKSADLPVYAARP